MIGYRDTLYVFGGEVGFSNGVETPLWMYNITVSYENHGLQDLKEAILWCFIFDRHSFSFTLFSF